MEDTEDIDDETLFGQPLPVSRILDNPWPGSLVGRQVVIHIPKEVPQVTGYAGPGAWAELESLGAHPQSPVMNRALPSADMSRQEAEALAAAAARALKRCDEIDDAFGADRNDGAVARFQVEYGSGRYSFAAIRASGRWYVTGRRSPQGLTWDEFRRWLYDSGVRSADWLADGYDEEE